MNKVMIALIAGFVAGILLAPEKGSITRKKLNDGFDDLSNKLADLKEKFTPEESSEADGLPGIPKMSATV
ncbi:MAG: YtxH domain-containing protein [Chitinophagaceae bacterium]